jgi:hypothetical protein
MYKRHYVSIDDAIIDLQARGFSNDFCLLEEQLFCMQQNRALRNSEFNILETWYFPKGKLISQDMMLYGIECPDHYLKGILHITAKTTCISNAGNTAPETDGRIIKIQVR